MYLREKNLRLEDAINPATQFIFDDIVGAAMASQLSKAELLKAMGTQTSTCGWDMVCSYDLNTLNKAVLASFKERNLSGHFKFSEQYQNPITGQEENTDFDIKFGAPELSFVADRNGYCRIAMKIISATYKRTTQAGGVVEQGKLARGVYQVVVTTPLALVCGANNELAADGMVVSFTQPQEEVHQVFVSIATDNAIVDLLPEISIKDDNNLKILLSQIKKYFQYEVAQLHMALAGMMTTKENKEQIEQERKAEDAAYLAEVQKALKSGQLGKLVMQSHRGCINIQPKSFVISTSASEDAAALSMFIQTSNSGRPQGEASPVFQLSGKKVSPIPKGSSASVIFSRDFIQGVLLKEQLPKHNYKSVSVQNDTAPWTVVANFNLDKKISAKAKHKNYVEATSDTIHLDFSQPTYSYRYSHNDNKITLSLPEISASYKWHMPNRGMSPVGAAIPMSTDKVKVSISLNKAFSFKASAKDIVIDMPITADDYVINYDNPKHFKSDCEQYNKTMDTEIKKVLPKGSGLFKKINFSAVSDLLFPGEQKLTIDEKATVYTPCDLVLFGNLN